MKLLGSLLLAALLLLIYPKSAYATPIRGGEIFTRINSERVENHLQALRVSPALVKAAQLKADDMARRVYFAHRTPDGKNSWDFMVQAGGRFWLVGENLAVGFTTTEAVSDAWMKSPTHRANILESQFTHTGIAISKDGKYVAQYFGN